MVLEGFPFTVDQWPVTLLRDSLAIGQTDASAVAPQAAEATIATRDQALAAIAIALVAAYGTSAVHVLATAGLMEKENQ